MSNLLAIPYEDDFETTLSQSWSGSATTINVRTIPTATTPAGSNYTYIVVSPGKSNMQVRKVTAWTGTTITCDTTVIKKGSGVNYSDNIHASGSIVRFSNNYQFWADIQTAIATKLDSNGGNATTTFDLDLSGSAFRIRKDGNDMKFTDDNTPETTLTQLASGSGADQKVAVSVTDTTTGTLTTKLTAGDGLKKTIINPGGAEELDLDIETSDTTIFVKTSSGVGDENKVPVLDATGKLALGFVPYQIGSDGIQTDADLTITGSNNTHIYKDFTSWTAGSVSRTCTITPTNCITHINIRGDADFTNWTFNFAGKGAPGGVAPAVGVTGNIGTVGNTSNYALLCNAGNLGTGPGPSGGAGAVKSSNTLLTTNINNYPIMLFCGAGGGSGGGGTSSGGTGGAGGAGGAGGGCLIITVGGNIILSSTVATVSGVNGSNGTAATGGNGSGGGGGGGAGGTFSLLYKGTNTGTLTPTVTGGSASTGGVGGSNAGGSGGSGGATIFAGSTAGSNNSGGTNNSTGGNGSAGAVGYYVIKNI